MQDLPPPGSETPSGSTVFDNEDGPVLVPDEKDSDDDTALDQAKDQEDSFSDDELRYPTGETPPPVDEMEHFMESYMRFSSVALPS